MVNYRKYISSAAVLASGFFLAQSTVSTVLYSQNYDNQKNSLNLPSPLVRWWKGLFCQQKSL